MENLGNLEDSGRCGNTGAIQDMSWPDSSGTSVNPAAIDALLRSVRQPYFFYFYTISVFRKF